MSHNPFMIFIQQATAQYPRFADRRIDYTNERICYVLNCVVVAEDKVLLTRRSADVIAYPNTLNGVSGFIDNTSLTLEEQAKTELTEELQLPTQLIRRIAFTEPFIQIDESINREWHVHAALVLLDRTFVPITNWENKSAEWFFIAEANSLQLMPGFEETLEKALALKANLAIE